MATLDEKQHAHELIERLPGDRITTVVRFLELMLLDPMARSLAVAPVDDEPLTEEEREALDRSEAWFRERGGKGIPMEAVLADFGLTMDDFPFDKGKGGS